MIYSYLFVVVILCLFFSSSIPFLSASNAGLLSSSSSSSLSSSSFIRHQFSSRSISHIEAVENYSIVIGQDKHHRTTSNNNNNININNNNNNNDDQNWSHHWKNHHAMSMIDEENYLPLVDGHSNNHYKIKSNNNNNNNHINNNNNNNNNNNHINNNHINNINNNNNQQINRFRAEGSTWIEPFPSSISVSFRVFGIDYHYSNIKLNRDLFSDDIGLNFDNKKQIYKHMRATYSAGQEEIGDINDIYPSWVVITLEIDGRFTARLSKNGTILQIDNSNIHIDDLHEGIDNNDHYRIKNNQYNPHSLVAFYSHHRTYFPTLLNIKGEKKSNNNNNNNNEATLLSDGPFAAPNESGHGRRLLMSKWTNCFPNDSIKRRFFIGIAMDVGYYGKVGGTPASASNSISTVIATTNKVFETQLNIALQVGDSTIRSALDSDEWNNLASDKAGNTCGDTGDVLGQFTAWRRDVKGNNLGAWHLFGACNYGGGIAWQSVTCLNTGAALSNWYPSFWQTFAHELGHNFGASHPFDSNTTTIGKWGGIMDYYDHTIKNASDQFASVGEVAYASTANTNKQSVKDDMCQHITQSLAGTNIEWAGSRRLPTSACWANFDAPFTTLPPSNPTTGPPTTTTPPPPFPSSEFLIQWSPYPDHVINGAAQTSQYNGVASSDQKFIYKSSTNQIQLSGTTKCIDISDEKIYDNLTPVLLWDCDTTGTKLNQKFIRRGLKMIQVQASTKCLDVNNGGTTFGVGLIIYECNDQQPNQQFNFITPGTATTAAPVITTTTIKQSTTGSPATTTTPAPTTTTIKITTTTPSPAPASTTTKLPPTQFAIYWKSHQDRVVDINDGINADGTGVKFWVPNGANGNPGAAQLFEWVNNEQLRWVGTNKCLDVFNGANQDGTVIKLYTCNANNNNANQKFVRVGDQIQWKGRNKCFNVANGQYDPAGALLQIWKCNTNAVNQQFVFTPTIIKTNTNDIDLIQVIRRDDFIANDGSITNPNGNGDNNDNDNNNDNSPASSDSSSSSSFSIPMIAAIGGGCGLIIIGLIVGVIIYRHKKHSNNVTRSTKDIVMPTTAV